MKVSVVVLNWNGKQYLRNCLGSLYAQTYKGVELIFVDNASTDDSASYVKKNFPKAKIIENRKNLGFAEGNNRGIRAAKGDYIFILNNDTKLDKNCLKELVKAAEQDKKIGMVSPKMLYYDTKKIDTIGLKLLKFGFTKDIKDETIKPLCPCGGAAFYKKEMLEDIKLNSDYFDSDYFIYAEDFDLGFRAFLRGWKSAYAKNAVVYHIHGATMRKQSTLSVYLGDRNRIWTIIKNYPTILLIKYMPLILLVQFASIIKYTLKGKPVLILKAKIDAVKGLPKMLEKRKIIQKRVKITNFGLLFG